MGARLAGGHYYLRVAYPVKRLGLTIFSEAYEKEVAGNEKGALDVDIWAFVFWRSSSCLFRIYCMLILLLNNNNILTNDK